MSWRPCAAAIALALALAPRPAAQSARGTGAILGQVVNSIDGRGVPAAIVRLSAGGVMQTRIADDRGRFYFRDLPAGTFAIHATKTGFIDGAYGKRRAGGVGIPLVLAARQIVVDATVELFRPATVSGIVVDEAGEPVIGARVLALRRQFVANGWRYVPAGAQLTNDEGRYRIFGLVPGEYVLSVPASLVTIPAATLEAIGTTGSSTAETIALVTMNGLMPGGAAALANAMRMDADERTVVLRARSPTPPKPDGRRQFSYPTQYYPAADVPSHATTVAIAPGEDHGGVNFQLQPVSALRIEGTAVGPDGPAANQMLRLLRADADDHGFGTETAATVTARDGGFTFVHVPPGRYRIEARNAVSFIVSQSGGQWTTLAGTPMPGAAAPGGPPIFTRDFEDLGVSTATLPLSDGALWGREDVTVNDDDVRGLTIELMPPVTVGGYLMFEGQGRRPGPEEVAQVRIALEPADSSAMALAPARATESGAFTFRGVVPGQYFVRISGAPRDWFVRSITSRGRDAGDEPFEALAASGAVLTIAFSTRGTNIAGTVRDARNLGVPGATVLAFPSTVPGRSGVAGSHRQREVRTSAHGAYSLDGLPPGDYFIAAIDDAAAEGWQDARSLQKLRSVASRVSLRANEHRTLDLRLIARK